MKILVTAAALVGLFSFAHGQQKTPKKLPPDYSFTFRYYELCKDKDASGFDSARLWGYAKLKKTFYNKGSIFHNHTKESLRWRLTGEKESEVHHIVRGTKDYARTIDAIRYFRFKDEVLGPSVAVYFPENNSWVIYRANPVPKVKNNVTAQISQK